MSQDIQSLVVPGSTVQFSMPSGAGYLPLRAKFGARSYDAESVDTPISLLYYLKSSWIPAMMRQARKKAPADKDRDRQAQSMKFVAAAGKILHWC